MALVIIVLKKKKVGDLEKEYTGIPYLMHLIKILPGYWVNHMVKMNQVVGDNSPLDALVGSKYPGCPFRRNKFCKCIGYILWEVPFRAKIHQFWRKPEPPMSKKGKNAL